MSYVQELEARVAELEECLGYATETLEDGNLNVMAGIAIDVLNRTPRQSLARVRAETLREAVMNHVYTCEVNGVGVTVVDPVDILKEADRIEQEAQDEM